jgi:RNA polymerase sigma-70 factor (ECF subfamily)
LLTRNESNPEAGNDEQLMKRIMRGDRLAFEMLYDRYFDKLVWYARGFVAEVHKAEDLVQEVFVKIIEKPEVFNPTQRFSTWIYTVTGNACRSALRKETNRLRLWEEEIAPYRPHSTSLQHELDHKHLKGQIQKVVEALSEKEKTIFTLRFEQELSIREISEIAGIPEGSVKSGIYYMLRKFEGQLKDFSYGS